MSDDRLDLSPLDLAPDELRFERNVRAIMMHAEPLLAARRRRLALAGQIARWRRPMLAAAAAIALLAGGILVKVHEEHAARGGVPEALGVPSRLAEWIRGNDLPAPGEVLAMVAETR